MLKCWSYDPDKRPTFKYCLSLVNELYLQHLRNPVTGAHEGQYISTVPFGKPPPTSLHEPHTHANTITAFAAPDGVSNQAYFQDENHNSGN